MMIRIGDFSLTPAQYGEFIDMGILNYRMPFALEVTMEELKVLESMVEETEKVSLFWGSIPVYVKEPK